MKNKQKTTHRNDNTKIAKKSTKKLKNWSEYNKSLANRGNLRVIIDEEVIRQSSTILRNKNRHKNGHPFTYSDELIKMILMIRELFRLPLRQTTGLIMFLFEEMGIKSDIPDYSTLSRRMANLKIDFLPKNTANTASRDIVMLIDSSGFKVFGEGEWKVRKHGHSYRRTWREMHIAVDHKTRNIIGVVNTTAHVHDNTQLRPLLTQVAKRNGYRKIKAIIGDGAYDAKDNYLLGRKFGIEIIAPPPKNAIEHLNTGWHHQWYDTPGWEERNQVVRHIEEFGLDGWMADTDYHRRSLVENAFYRLKTIFGERLKSRSEANQTTEQMLKAMIINKFNQLGLPKYSETI